MSETKDFKKVVAEVKLAYDIVDYIQQSGITLKQRGNKNLGLCPFHSEKSPSFTVDSHFQNYRCFGCGEHGDLISFVEKYERLDFMEAVRKLAEDKNIAIEINSDSTIDYKSLKSCIRSAANFFVKEFRKLNEDHPAKLEITNRGLSTRGFLYGYAPEGRNTLFNFLKEQGFTEETILLTGVCRKSDKTGYVRDFWQGRLMFVITDISGRPIGFSGRKLYETDTMGKYVNSSDGPLFDKGNALFNIEKAKKQASDEQIIYVNEGQFDVVALVESGLSNVVASSGTAFTTNQALMCRRLVSDSGKIVFCFDGDKAGIEAALKVFKNTPAIHSQSYVVSFPEGMDPCDYKDKYGSEELVKHIQETQIPLVEFVINNIASKYKLESALDRSNYVEEVAKTLITISNIPLRESYIRRVSLDSFTPVEVVREIVSKSKSVSPEKAVEQINISQNDTPQDDSKEKEYFAARNYEESAVEETEKESYVSYEDLVSLIKHDNSYSAAAKILSLTLSEPRFIPALLHNEKLMPLGFESIVEDLKTLQDKETLIPELFDRSDVVNFIVNSNLLPFSHLMNVEHQKKHFKYLMSFLKKIETEEKADYVRSNIAKVLQKSSNVDSPVELLEKALKKEKKMLEVSE